MMIRTCQVCGFTTRVFLRCRAEKGLYVMHELLRSRHHRAVTTVSSTNFAAPGMRVNTHIYTVVGHRLDSAALQGDVVSMHQLARV